MAEESFHLDNQQDETMETSTNNPLTPILKVLERLEVNATRTDAVMRQQEEKMLSDFERVNTVNQSLIQRITELEEKFTIMQHEERAASSCSNFLQQQKLDESNSRRLDALENSLNLRQMNSLVFYIIKCFLAFVFIYAFFNYLFE